MTAAEIEVTTDDHQKKTKKGIFGSTKTTKTEQAPPEQAKKEPSDDGSVASTSSTKKATTNWYGKEVKRPRAEYQAEIDELKLQIVELQVKLATKTSELQQFKDWVGMAPSAF